MRGFNIGDRLTTKDGKHSGIVTLVEADEKEYRLPFLMDIEKQAIETVLEELEKKDKIIDLMAEQLAGLAIFDIDKDESLILGDKEEIKQYFKEKVEG